MRVTTSDSPRRERASKKGALRKAEGKKREKKEEEEEEAEEEKKRFYRVQSFVCEPISTTANADPSKNNVSPSIPVSTLDRCSPPHLFLYRRRSILGATASLVPLVYSRLLSFTFFLVSRFCFHGARSRNTR